MKLNRLEPIIIILVILLVVTLNMTAFVYRSFTTPPGRNFVGTQFYSDDYAIYVSHIKQGQQGAWQIKDKFTSEPHNSSLVHEEYLLWGKLTGLLGIPAILSYHLARLLGALGLLTVFYLFLLKIFPKVNEAGLRIVSFILGTLSAGFLERVGGIKQPYLAWLTDLDITQRFAPVPHYLLGFIGLFLVFSSLHQLINKFDKKTLKKSFLTLVSASLIGTFALPSSFFVILSVLAIFGLFNLGLFILKRGKEPLRALRLSIITGLVLALVNLPTIIYYQFALKYSIWSIILELERFNRGVFTFKDCLLALGPIAFLAPLGLLAIKKRMKLLSFLIAWVLTVFGWSFWLADLVGLNPTRFLQALVYIPLSILATLGLSQVAKKITQKYQVRFLLIITGLIILIGLPTSQVSLKSQLDMYVDHTDLIYPEDFFLEAYRFLEEKTKSNQVVLALYQSGNHFPFLSGNTTYLGHLQGTLNYDRKAGRASAFYSGVLPEKEAQEFLTKGGISFVFWGPQEKSIGSKIENYSFLKPIYQTPQVTIFKLDNN